MIREVLDADGNPTGEFVEDDTTINVLGATYTVKEVPQSEMPDDSDGFCDNTVHIAAVSDFADDKEKTEDERRRTGYKKDLDWQIRKNKRHEIVHAFLYESGLAENSPWATNEEIVDWFALQGPKIYAAWKEVGAVD